MKQTLIIGDAESLSHWNRQLRSLSPNSRPSLVEFRLPEFSEEENRANSALATSLHKACGCASSGFFMSVSVVTLVASYLVSGHRISDITLRSVLWLTGVTVLAALFGKTLGLIWSRLRLLRLAAALQKSLKEKKIFQLQHDIRREHACL